MKRMDVYLLEYAIAVICIVGGFSMFFAEPLTHETILYSIIGSKLAGAVYGSWFIALGLWLMTAKMRGFCRAKHFALLAVYLTTIFAIIIEVMLLGMGWFILDEIILGLLAATFWLKFRLSNYYFTEREIEEQETSLEKTIDDMRQS